MYTIEKITTYEQFAALEGIWNDVAARSASETPFMSFEFLSCCLRALKHTANLMVLVVKDGEEIVALAPFHRIKYRLGGIPTYTWALIGEEFHCRNELILARQDPEILTAIAAYVQKAGCGMLSLDVVPALSQTGLGVGRLTRENLVRCVELPSDTSPYIPVASSWEEYFQGRSKNFRHKLNRTRNLFERIGAYEVAVYRRENIDRAVKEMRRIALNSWKQESRRKAAIAGAPEALSFHEMLAYAAAERGWLAIWMLRVKGQPVAYAYNLEYKERVYALKIEFDERYDNLSPSEFLNTQAIRDCFEKGFREYDWLGINLPFKMKWTSVCREHRKYLVFTRSLRGTALYLWRNYLIERLKKRMRRGKDDEPPGTERPQIIAKQREGLTA